MIEMIRQGICMGIVCADIDPGDSNAFDRLDQELKGEISGTENGWGAVRPDSKDFHQVMKCDSKEGRSHHLIECGGGGYDGKE